MRKINSLLLLTCMRGIAISILQHQYLLAAMRRVAEITIFGAIVCCRKAARHQII